MGTTVDEYLNRPLSLPPRQPIRVAVYSRLASGIRSGTLPPGTLLPRESELADMLNVSRTPVREALILLEEDGLITTKRGVGRFVADHLPSTGLETIRPFEQVLADTGGRVDIMPLRFSADPATEFVADHLRIEVATTTWFRECVISLDGTPAAIAQEHFVAGYDARTELNLDATLGNAADDKQTLLAALIKDQALTFDSGECHIVPSTAGNSRASLLNVEADDPVLVLTETIAYHGTPIYLGKYIVSKAVPALAIIQSAK